MKTKTLIKSRVVIWVGAVVIVALAGWLWWEYVNFGGSTTISHGEVRIHGHIRSDTCYSNHQGGPPTGDLGCSVTVNGYDVSVQFGNIIPPSHPGTVTGLDVSRDQVGSKVDVYAKQSGPHSAWIWDDPKYYVHIE